MEYTFSWFEKTPELIRLLKNFIPVTTSVKKMNFKLKGRLCNHLCLLNVTFFFIPIVGKPQSSAVTALHNVWDVNKNYQKFSHF